MDRLHGIGSHIKLAVGTPPASAAGTVNGAYIDRLGFDSCVLEAVAGAATGGPSGQTLDARLQHSDATGSGFVDFVPGAAGSGAVAQIAADSTRKRKSIDLRGAKRYIRVVNVVALTGGTTPTWPNYVGVILGGADSLAAQADD